MEATEPKLEHLFDIHADLEAAQVVGATPQGMRQIFIVKGGTFEGPRVKGKMLPGGRRLGADPFRRRRATRYSGDGAD